MRRTRVGSHTNDLDGRMLQIFTNHTLIEIFCEYSSSFYRWFLTIINLSRPCEVVDVKTCESLTHSKLNTNQVSISQPLFTCCMSIATLATPPLVKQSKGYKEPLHLSRSNLSTDSGNNSSILRSYNT